MRLKDRSAIVTGAAMGIGAACAEVFLAEGARVAIVDIDAETGTALAARLAATYPGRVIFQPADVSDAAAVTAAVDAAEAAFGTVDALVNAAAIVRKGTVVDLDPADFEFVFRVNLLSGFLMGQQVAKRLVAAGRPGAIVNLSSVNGQVAIADQTAYVAMKGGVNQLTKAMALALAPHGIRVNAVAPGSIRTEMFAKVANNPAILRSTLSRTPLGRPGEPAEVAKLCAFLASDDAAYITGEVVVIDGGRMALNYTVPVPEGAVDGG
ncbi:MAG: SDR family oxidoreductase [Rhodospirillaceae bacterium]|nr:SDR family oxidoreductase [Rhodospirillaceae bacterium]